jgi:hypothetical protein
MYWFELFIDYKVFPIKLAEFLGYKKTKGERK